MDNCEDLNWQDMEISIALTTLEGDDGPAIIITTHNKEHRVNEQALLGICNEWLRRYERWLLDQPWYHTAAQAAKEE